MSYVLRLKVSENAELELSFDSLEALKSHLEALDFSGLTALLEGSVGQSLAPDERPPRPELTGIASRGPMGKPRFSKIPSSKAAYAALVLFAVEPRHLDSKEIEEVTGIKRVASHYFSPKAYRRFFTKDDAGKFSLTTEGKRWVTEVVLPAMG